LFKGYNAVVFLFWVYFRWPELQLSFVELSEIADSVESSFQGVNDFLDFEVKWAQRTLQDKLLRVSELEQQIQGFKTRIQENAVNIRNKQEEYEIYSKQFRSLEIQMR
jgi:hypothetical protein